MKKSAYHEITGVIRCVSGVRIGGSDDMLQIGGTDLTCIKHPVTLKPYLPGSSLKGKMRSELEAKYELAENDKPFTAKKQIQVQGRTKQVSKSRSELRGTEYLLAAIFGPHMNTDHDFGPSRIIVRDAQLLEGGETELKSENVIDRKTGTALHPRKLERIVSGSAFTFRIGIHEWDLDKDVTHAEKRGGEALIAFVLEGLKLVQQTGLGSGISKGSGEIQFEQVKVNGNDVTLG
jgi:CRISPR-associated protein Csm3